MAFKINRNFYSTDWNQGIIILVKHLIKHKYKLELDNSIDEKIIKIAKSYLGRDLSHFDQQVIDNTALENIVLLSFKAFNAKKKK